MDTGLESGQTKSCGQSEAHVVVLMPPDTETGVSVAVKLCCLIHALLNTCLDNYRADGLKLAAQGSR